MCDENLNSSPISRQWHGSATVLSFALSNAF
jgi:hypothetical protein